MRILILGPGSVKGAYQVGILKYLIEELNLSWDVIIGISVGSLNGAFLSQYNKSEQSSAILNLEKIWKSIKGNKDIYKSWLSLPFIGMSFSAFTGGLYSTKPLKKLLNKNFNQKKQLSSDIKLVVGSVATKNGECQFIENNNSINICDWIMASSAMPVAFPPIKINGEHYIDGGMRKTNSPLEIALKNYNPTEIDMLFTNPINKISETKINNNNAMSIAIRAIQILNEDYLPQHLIDECKKRNVKLNLISPKESLNVDLLNFDPDIIELLMFKGYYAAKKNYKNV